MFPYDHARAYLHSSITVMTFLTQIYVMAKYCKIIHQRSLDIESFKKSHEITVKCQRSLQRHKFPFRGMTKSSEIQKRSFEKLKIHFR